MSDLLLEIVEGPDAGRRMPLDDAIELGRDTGLAHALDDAKVSRRHARVNPVGRGASLEDLGSTNGTFLNEAPLEIATALKPGDRIRVGLTVLELRRAEDRGTAAAPVPQLTQISADVLEPVASRDLPPLPPPPEPEPVAVRAPTSEPRYVNTRIGQRIDELIPPRQGGPPPPSPAGGPPAPKASAEIDPSTDDDYRAVAHLVDARVKARTNVAAFTLLAIAALAVIIYFGVT